MKRFSRGTNMTEAYRACGCEIGGRSAASAWCRRTRAGTLVVTLWVDTPKTSLIVRNDLPKSLALRLRTEHEPGESDTRRRKLEEYNAELMTAARDGADVIVLGLAWRRDESGQFVADQEGAAVPVWRHDMRAGWFDGRQDSGLISLLAN